MKKLLSNRLAALLWVLVLVFWLEANASLTLAANVSQAVASGMVRVPPHELDPQASGQTAQNFGDSVVVGENYILIYTNDGWGSVQVYDKNTFAFLGVISAPDRSHDAASFGRTMGESGKTIFIGNTNTYRFGAHDGTGYLFKTGSAGNFEKIAAWAENPNQWAAYFGTTGGLFGDLLISAQGSNPGRDSKGMLFFYAFNPTTGAKNLVRTYVEAVSGTAPQSVSYSGEQVAVSYGAQAGKLGDVRLYNVARNSAKVVVDATLVQTLPMEGPSGVVTIQSKYLVW